jgi:hypothetical protein
MSEKSYHSRYSKTRKSYSIYYLREEIVKIFHDMSATAGGWGVAGYSRPQGQGIYEYPTMLPRGDAKIVGVQLPINPCVMEPLPHFRMSCGRTRQDVIQPIGSPSLG